MKKTYAVGLISSLVLAGFISHKSVALATSSPIEYNYDFKTLDNSMWQEKWAIDNFSSKVKFTPIGEGCYTYEREDGGTFETLGTKSPGGDGTTTVAAGVKGTISGGIKGQICGDFKEDISNNSPEDLTVGSYPSYEVKYFHHFFEEESIGGFSITDWGWVFASCGNGTWTDNERTEAAWQNDKNAMGDIKGEPAACQNPTPAPVPGAGQQSKTAISDPVCKDSNFDARIQLSLDSKEIKDVQVKFVYNNEAKYAKTGEDGWAGVAFGYRSDSNVEFYPEQGYPTQLQKVTLSSSCKTPVVLGVATSGKVLGVTTLAKTGGEEMLVNLAGMVGAGLTAAGVALKLKKKN